MEVTRKNFKETLPLVADSIQKSDFLVIDAEFTGLINGKNASVFDSPQEYYSRLLEGSTEFLLIQYGLCAFYWNEEGKHYMNDSYNFYLFPRGRPGPEKTFLCQSSSLDYLAAQGFDFNKVIREGISYMTEPVETRLRESLTERQNSYSNVKESITVPDELKQQIQDTCKKVRQFLDENKSETMEIDRCNAFVRRLLYQELGTQFKNEAFVETKVLDNKDRILTVSRLKLAADGKSRDQLKMEKEWEEVEDAVGFSKVARMISQSDKLVIGHNMLLDVMHTLNHFFQPLPDDYGDFKEFAHCMFPRLLDTKYMSSLPPFKEKVSSSVLQHLLATLSEPPFSLPNIESRAGRGYRNADDKYHEAGFDAYVTGLCFLAMHAHLARMRGDQSARVATRGAALQPFLNKLFLARTAPHDSPYMHLAGPDPTPSRDHVFHLTFPVDWQRNDINQLFSPFGPVIVQFLDETSALVALARREQARSVVRALSGHANISLVTYAWYKRKGAMVFRKQDSLKREHPSTAPDGDSPSTTEERQASSADLANNSAQKTPTPEKVVRTRSSSMSTPASHAARKRTSSGVFHVRSLSAAYPDPMQVNQTPPVVKVKVDEAEPPPKKTELTQSNIGDSDNKTDTVPRGRRKISSESEKERMKVNGKETVKDNDMVKENGNGKERVKRSGKERLSDEQDKEKKSLQNLDSDSKPKCVTAFKESDSWD